jgi:hypothetical protein
MERYFDKFPIIRYSNNNVVDITLRVKLLDRISANPYAFYPYTITDSERADQFSSRYYKDPYQSWLIYLTNNIVDPYYEWYLDEEQFIEYLDKKYQSYFTAQQKIKYYQNNWENQENINLSEYNALPSSMRKYWSPLYGTGSNVTGYERIATDWSTSTNKVVSYAVSNNAFVYDEICDIVFDQDNVGKGQVIAAANNVLYLQHMSGSFYTSDDVTIKNNSYIYGTESNVNTVFTSVSSVANNISEEELIYWKPITYYEYELNRNEFNKTLKVIDSDFAQLASDSIKELLRND